MQTCTNKLSPFIAQIQDKLPESLTTDRVAKFFIMVEPLSKGELEALKTPCQEHLHENLSGPFSNWEKDYNEYPFFIDILMRDQSGTPTVGICPQALIYSQDEIQASFNQVTQNLTESEIEEKYGALRYFGLSYLFPEPAVPNHC